MSEFEQLLQENILPLKRYVAFKIHHKHDAEDIVQEVCLTATLKFSSLQNPTAFKAWLIGIAAHKCNDYYRKKAKHFCLSLDALSASVIGVSRFGITARSTVQQTLDALGDKEKQIIYLYFFKNMSQTHYAKEKFKQQYLDYESSKGENTMKKLPEYLPEYSIEKSELAPFSVKWEELQGWLLVPRVGEELTWGLYDIPSRKRTEYTEMKTIGKAEVHGIEGVEIVAVQYGAEDYYRTGCVDQMERRFVAQLTDTHCRYLAQSHIENGVRKLYTFLDGEEFLNNWGFGEDNCGNEVNLSAKGLLSRDGNVISGQIPKETVDIVGRYTVKIGEKSYDTVCVMDIQCFNDGVASEQYLDRNGRTVLWRRFNKNDWAHERYGKLWTEMLPQNQRLIINGETYVHWYDCLSSYVM